MSTANRAPSKALHERQRLSFTAVAKELLPPIVIRLLRLIRSSRGKPAPQPESTIEFHGIYSNWLEARRASEGYDADTIFAKVREATRAVKAGRAIFERDGALFSTPAYRFPLLACIQHAYLAQKSTKSFHVVDFGGSLASVYFQNRPFLELIPGLLWSIIEQPKFVTCGNEEFSDSCLKFFLDLDQALHRHPIDVALCSSVLQYLPDPYECLEKLSAHSRWLLIDRTPVSRRDDDWLTVQHVPKSLYVASYPHWCFSEQKLLARLGVLGFEKLAEFESFDRGTPDFDYRGYLFQRR
jgi:putative methyltransferase (TIGR04325 family)